VWVHGHAQCGACGVTTVPCCEGAGGETRAREPRSSSALPADAGTLVALLRAEGPLLREALLNRLAELSGSDLDTSARLLEATLRAGLVEACGPDVYRAAGSGT